MVVGWVSSLSYTHIPISFVRRCFLQDTLRDYNAIIAYEKSVRCHSTYAHMTLSIKIQSIEPGRHNECPFEDRSCDVSRIQCLTTGELRSIASLEDRDILFRVWGA